MLAGKIKQLEFKPDVLGEQISRILSESILEGLLKGGDKLVEAQLQKQFKISRSPLREAFRDLEKKGLVVITPRKGTFVRQITRRDIENNFPVRAALEGLAARLALKSISKAGLKTLGQTLQKMELAVEKQDAKTYWKHHLAYHEIFITASGNEVLISTLKTLRMHSLWYRFSYQYYREDLPKSLAVHRTIYRLFNDRRTDPGAIEAEVKTHIEVAFERFLAYLRSQQKTASESLAVVR